MIRLEGHGGFRPAHPLGCGDGELSSGGMGQGAAFAVDGGARLHRQRRARWLRRRWPWLAALLALLIGVRIALPYALAWEMNRVLAAPGAYQGHVDGITLDLWRGAYQVHGLALTVKRKDGLPKPLIAAERVGISLDWGQLLRGRVRSSIVLGRPRLVIVPSGPPTAEIDASDVALPKPAMEGRPGQAAKPPRERWQERVGSVIAFRIDSLRVEHGTLQYLDEGRGVEVGVSDIGGQVREIAGGKESRPTSATFDLSGGTTGGGTLRVEGRADPWALAPTFDVRAEIVGLHLVGLNASAKHLNGLAFRKGVFSAYAEAHASDGDLAGYVKPLFIDLDVASYGRDEDNAAKKLFWKAAIVVAENLLPNDETDALAARIPIAGRFDKPETDTWSIIASVLGNAFMNAILPGFEGMTRFTAQRGSGEVPRTPPCSAAGDRMRTSVASAPQKDSPAERYQTHP